MTSLHQAVQERHLEPSKLLRSFQVRGIPKSTLHDCETGKHAPRGVNGNRSLSLAQEKAILAEIDAYAQQGTLLTPANIAELAKELCGSQLSKNWASKFVNRPGDQLDAKYYVVQEAARLKADTLGTRQAFYRLVSAEMQLFAVHANGR